MKIILTYILLLILNVVVYCAFYITFGTFFWGVIVGIIQMTLDRVFIEGLD